MGETFLIFVVLALLGSLAWLGWKYRALKNRIFQLEQQLNLCQSKANAITAWMEKFEALLNTKTEVKDLLSEIKDQIKAASTYEASKERIKQYLYLSDSVAKLEKQREPLSDFFKDKMPTEDELNEFDDMTSGILKTRGELASFELTPQEKEKFEEYGKIFSEGVPDEETIKSFDDSFDLWKQLEAEIIASQFTNEEEEKFGKLSSFFSKRSTDETEVDQYLNDIGYLNQLNSTISTLKVKLSLIQNSPSAQSNQPGNSSFGGFAILILAFLFMAGGGALFFVIKPLGISMLILGFLLGIGGFFIGIKKNKANKKAAEEQLQKQNHIITEMENTLSHQIVEKETIDK
ncbi:MAG: hypothetical protein HGA25_03440, partial [Clostridiales bacterium]|nr:hypothetical protein [Clostridiales bacterium]